MNCKILAYASAIYTIASIFYLVRTRSIGTPFNDSLSEEQKQIKKQSAYERKSIFVQGIVLACLLLYFSNILKC